MQAGYLLLCAVAALFGTAHGDFVLITEDCFDQNHYSYDYNVTETYYEGDLLQVTTSVFTFGVECIGEGTYMGDDAILYNLTDVVEAEISGTLIDEMIENGEDVNASLSDLVKSLAGNFSFVLIVNTSNAGIVPVTYYDSAEEEEIVNIKKTLAASFQAVLVFKGGNEIGRTELDPQALHNTTYTQDVPGCSGNCETREITDADINGFASAISNDLVDYYSKDVLKVKSNLVVSEEGDMIMKIVQPDPDYLTYDEGGEIPIEEIALKDSIRAKLHKRSSDIDDSYDPNVATNHYVTSAHYHMDQTGISKRNRQKRSFESVNLHLKNMASSDLRMTVNQTKKAINAMKIMRQQLGDISDALARLHDDTEQTEIASKIETLVKIEAKHGPPPGMTPAIHDVIDYLNMLIGSSSVQDVNMRLLLYYILTPEGSLPAQMALVNGLEHAVDEEEEEKVLIYIAFMANPHPETVARIEGLINTDPTTKDPILLAYSSIVPRASPELQRRMVSFITDRLPIAEGNTNSLIHHILALGNTESPKAKSALMGYLHHPDEDVQLAAIFSLSTLLHNPMVQNRFREILNNPDITTSKVAMIAQALAQGYQQAVLRENVNLYPEDLLLLLVHKTIAINDEELFSTVSGYLADINTAESRDFLRLLHTYTIPKPASIRQRRGSVWDEVSTVYDLVSPLEERKKDVATYTNHRAYIWGLRLGVSDINVQVAAGTFVGVASNGAYKVFGRAVAQGKVYDKRTNFLEFTVMRTKSSSSTESRLFGKVMGKVLKDIDLKQEASVCKTFTAPIYNGPLYTVFDFTYSLYVKIGTLDLKVKATTKFDTGLEVAFCENMGSVTAGAKLTPVINFKVKGESDHTFAKILKAGVAVDADITYRLEPSVNSMVCYTQNQIRWKNCIAVHHQRKASTLKQYAYYAWRGWCGWNLCEGDKAYSNKKQVSDLSFEWSLPETDLEEMVKSCDNDFACN